MSSSDKHETKMSIQGCSHPYIPLSAVPNIEKFTYRGADLSYLYKYVLSPAADEFSLLLPMWLAPNLVTVAGFFCNIMAHVILIWYQGFGMDGPIPDWVIVFTGFMHLCYIFLDNVDGKQARRTKSSSVLGMLFDHGCDAYTTMFLIINISKVLQAGNNNGIGIIGILIVSVPFYFATLESYYIGGVFLPEFNAVNEGSLILFGLCISAVFFGYNALVAPFMFGMTLAMIVGYSLLSACVLFSSLNLYAIFFRPDRVRPADAAEVLRATLFPIVVTLVMYASCLYTPGNILQTPCIPSYLYGLII